MIIVNKINRTVCSVLLDFTNDTTDTISIIGIIFLIQSNPIIRHRNQTPRFGDIESYTLMHDSDQIFCFYTGTTLFGITVRHFIRRENNNRICPIISIFGSHQKSLGGRHMFIGNIGQILQIELSVPISQHRLMIIGPPIAIGGIRIFPVSPHHLYVMYTDYGR